MKDKQLTIDEKIEKIKTSESFEDLKTGWFPQSASTSYYFVSYCHKDYKKVFVDILGMQQHDSEIAVWYDRELSVGLDWEKEAKTHIYDFDCLGVIFYLSENAVKSPAIFKEMQMTMEAHKRFIPIVLPAEDIRGKRGEYLSGVELFDTLFPCISENDERYRLYHKMFDEKIIYFKDTDPPSQKTAKIKELFTRIPLLEFRSCMDTSCENSIEVAAVNNINAIEIGDDDYIFLGKNNQPMDIDGIGKCAFSNCRLLETVVIPKTVQLIGEYAFCNCKKLNTITIPEDSRLKFIDDHAFDDCSNLTSITIPDGVVGIGQAAFCGCSGLTSITIPDGVADIGQAAFCDCHNLTSITIPDGVTSIGDSTFYHCSNLSSITIPNRESISDLHPTNSY